MLAMDWLISWRRQIWAFLGILHVEVPECIEKPANAEIKIWVLTGDKMVTTINIGGGSSITFCVSPIMVLLPFCLSYQQGSRLDVGQGACSSSIVLCRAELKTFVDFHGNELQWEKSTEEAVSIDQNEANMNEFPYGDPSPSDAVTESIDAGSLLAQNSPPLFP
ncbi:hypothetical protein SSX86_022745 [Deinandra increscens subsp. villosa]|uniref:Uncharacterized protein n=1 Tax=Deinandra increscens subsp. villosa TaxID=3103831 RepID=A0AAP0CL34_9ASTR